MIKTIEIKVVNGLLEPLEKIDLPEGKKFTVMITDEQQQPSNDKAPNKEERFLKPPGSRKKLKVVMDADLSEKDTTNVAEIDAFKKAAGAWKGDFDTEALIDNLYAAREIYDTRPIVRL